MPFAQARGPVRLTWALGACVLGLVALGACKPKSETQPGSEPHFATPILGDVLVKRLGPADEQLAGVAFDDRAMSGQARERLEASRIFAPRPSEAAGGGSSRSANPEATVLAAYAVENVWAEGKGLARALVRLKVAVKPSRLADPYWAEDVEAQGEIPYDTAPESAPPARAFTTLVSRMMTEMLDEYIARQQLRRAEDSVLLAALKERQSAHLEDALRIAGRRKLQAAVPALLELLNDEREPVRDAALGALLEMRERRAVKVLTTSRSMHDTREMRKILNAIAVLGGNEAVSYLNFVADAHEDPELRAYAREALGKLTPRPEN